MFYLKNGIRLVVKGIARSMSPPRDTKSGIDRSFLMSLCEDGLQKVKVTKMHKKMSS